MSVDPASVCLHWAGSTARISLPNTPNYTAVYRCKTTDPLDQSKTVTDWFQANYIPLGTPYEYGNDTTSLTAVAKNIQADRQDTSEFDWVVVYEYGPPDQQDQEQRDQAGNPTENPLDWRPRISFGTVQYRRPVEAAMYVGGYLPDFENRYPKEGDARITPVNSAFVPFVNPPVEEDASRSWMMIGGNFGIDPDDIDVDKVDVYENWVNTVGFRVTHRGLTKDFHARQAKIRQIKIEPKTANNVDYVAIDWFIDKAVRRFTAAGGTATTWDTYVLDRGNHQRALAGDPDGKGGTIGQGDIPEGVPRLTPPTSPGGEVVVEDVLFDGNGRPLDMEVTPAPIEVFGQWRHYQETDFLQLEYLKDLIEAIPP